MQLFLQFEQVGYKNIANELFAWHVLGPTEVCLAKMTTEILQYH